MVSHLRRLSVDGDARLERLIGALAVGSTDSARLWVRYDVRSGVARRTAFRHRQAGTFELHPDVLTLAGSGQTLCLYRAEPGTPGSDPLVLLNTLAAADGPAVEVLTAHSNPADPTRLQQPPAGVRGLGPGKTTMAAPGRGVVAEQGRSPAEWMCRESKPGGLRASAGRTPDAPTAAASYSSA